MRSILAVCAVLFLGGCMQMKALPYLDQVTTLQAMSAEKDGQIAQVKAVDAKFDKLLTAVKSGDIKVYATKDSIVKAFGPPILMQEITANGEKLQQCLYRYTVPSMAKERVYLYFDGQSKLIDWDLL